MKKMAVTYRTIPAPSPVHIALAFPPPPATDSWARGRSCPLSWPDSSCHECPWWRYASEILQGKVWPILHATNRTLHPEIHQCTECTKHFLIKPTYKNLVLKNCEWQLCVRNGLNQSCRVHLYQSCRSSQNAQNFYKKIVKYSIFERERSILNHRRKSPLLGDGRLVLNSPVMSSSGVLIET